MKIPDKAVLKYKRTGPKAKSVSLSREINPGSADGRMHKGEGERPGADKIINTIEKVTLFQMTFLLIGR